MTQQADIQPQEGQNEQIVVQPGREDQVEGSAGDAQPGVDQGPEGASQGRRTYTQEEWDRLQSSANAAKANADRQTAQARQVVAEGALRQQIAEAESRAQAQDQQAVEVGDMTHLDAQQRAQQRQVQWQDKVREERQQAQQRAEHGQLVQQTEAMAKFQVANLLAKEHNVDARLLLEDASLVSGEQMEIKALKLAKEKADEDRTGTERFDAGQQGSSPPSVNTMSAEQKIMWGLNHPPKRAR